ncbi:hypothetical protein VNO77_12026 [Canavalia gladiata]|uniref:Glycosyltransferase n=1 Tax=Canavalia gladiata TaxID=3824 RepID=A0AAN9QQW3_CANGL
MESGVDGETEMLKAIFLPFVSPSHLIPVVDIARIFAMHGVDVTIITTPANAAVFQSSIDRDSNRGHSIRTHVVKFPQIAGLPEGMESINAATPKDMSTKISEGVSMLQGEFRQLFRDMQPDFIVTDMFYPWSVDAAAELGIPRIIYVGGTYMAHCAMDSLERFAPHTNVDSDDHSFLLPGLPHKLEMTRSQIPDRFKVPNHGFAKIMKVVKESEKRSYGSVFKSFYELEGAYEEHYKTVMGTKSWNVGPVSSWVNQDASDKAERGHSKEEQEGKGKEQGWFTWLNSKKQDSVVYVCFGSMNNFPASQLIEIAHGLEDSGHDFVWVVKKIDESQDDGVGVFLEEFEKRVQGSNRGYVIWGWAPQLAILEHPAIGGVVTHCGMNTVLESVDAALPMVTWPLFAEQFFNEKLLVDVLGIGVPVGSKKWRNWNEFGDEIVKREDIAKAIDLLMGGGEENVERRRNVKALSDAAKKAIQPGGSSYNSLKDLIEELKSLKLQKLSCKLETVA